MYKYCSRLFPIEVPTGGALALYLRGQCADRHHFLCMSTDFDVQAADLVRVVDFLTWMPPR